MKRRGRKRSGGRRKRRASGRGMARKNMTANEYFLSTLARNMNSGRMSKAEMLPGCS